MTSPEIKKMLQNGAVVLDVRTLEEYEVGHFDGSINIPVQVLSQSLNQLDKTKKFLICCASGGRSAMAEQYLRTQGYSDVYDVGAWKNLLNL